MRAGDLPLLVAQHLQRVERRDLVVEGTCRLTGRGALLALQRVGVLRFAPDAVSRGHVLGGGDHRRVDAGARCHQRLVDGAVPVAMVLHQRHRLESAGHRHVGLAAADRIGRHGDRIQPGGAFAVQRGRGHAGRQAGAQGGLARDVAAGGAFLPSAAEHHVVDRIGRHAGPLQRGADHVRAERGAVRVVERAAKGAADRRARGRDNCDVDHGRRLMPRRPPRRRAR